MSFDSTFEYSIIVDALNERIQNLENGKSSSEAELNVLTTLSDQYQSLAAEQIEYHSTKINCLDASISKLKTVLNEISVIQNLSSDSKNMLYNFYVDYVNPNNNFNSRAHWMRQMCYNSQDMIPYITNVMTDVNISPEQRTCIKKLICDKFGAKKETASFQEILLKQYLST